MVIVFKKKYEPNPSGSAVKRFPVKMRLTREPNPNRNEGIDKKRLNAFENSMTLRLRMSECGSVLRLLKAAAVRLLDERSPSSKQGRYGGYWTAYKSTF
jgi:hypothetical protein